MNTIQEASTQPEAKHRTVIVFVNKKPVVFHEKEATGAQIKATAIEQGVAIQQDFTLFIVKEHGKHEQVADNEEVKLHEQEKFRAVAPDDQS
jgi:Multiubiquitin